MNPYSKTTTLAALAGLALAAGSAQAAVIYNETFSGLGTTDLNGTEPDDTTGANTWAASTNWNKDGSVDASGANDDNAFLAFTPVAGKIYTLTATLTQPTGASWAAIGFTENADTTTTADSDFWRNIPAATAPWVLYRAASGNVDSFLGPLTGGVADEGDHPGGITMSIVLNTEAAAWTAEWFVGASSVRSETFGSNPTGINYVGLGRDGGTDVTFSNFSLSDNTVIPEPSTTALLGLGGLALILRRRK
jgi:hypothetical protein